MTLLIVRVFFLLVSVIVGQQIGDIWQQPLIGMLAGAGFGFILIALESNMYRVSLRGLSSMVFGLLLGMVVAKLITDILRLLPIDDYFTSLAQVVMTMLFCYLGVAMAIRGKDDFNLIIPYVRFRKENFFENVVILDTSAIIDGRVVDIVKTDFFQARLVIPRFILKELQQLSDSKDSIKRERGRRGSEILRDMQKDPAIDIKVHEEDLPEIREVDEKLLHLAKRIEARICTTDFNLNRNASIQGIKILNVNELANAVKPVVFPGDRITTKLIKEGTEHNQAVGYLDDGTMIVVSEARAKVGEEVVVEVTSALQTQAGRMIFAKLT
ncbi:MAG: PIN domain-containing protein [Candidatus Aceula meridiana]|nr:PIN domain-containing protein [Candidatus Aceula meridiana]